MKRKSKLKKEIETKEREKREIGKEGEAEELLEEKSRKKRKKRIRKESKKDNYFISRETNLFIAILVNIVLIYILNNLAKNSVDFITDRFLLCLPIINVSLGATIFGNFLFLVYNEDRFKSSVRVVLNLLSIAAIYTIYKVFPFDLSGISFLNLEFLMKVSLLLGMIAIGVAAIIEFFKVIFKTPDWK